DHAGSSRILPNLWARPGHIPRWIKDWLRQCYGSARRQGADGPRVRAAAEITLPNVDGLRPRAVTEMYSFDHDIGSFVAIGTGTVSDDGQVIRSNPGVGVLKAGWHCGGDPNANGSVADCPDCKICQGDHCVTDPAQEGHTCKTQSGAAGVCKNGTCVPSVKIEASFLNHDDPKNTSYATLAKGDPVYGGSEESTSDKLKMKATLESGAPSVSTYTWSVTGPGSGNYTPPAP